MPGLFTPLKLKGVTLKNRIAVSPMCQYSSTDGFANDWHLVHLGARAIGGAGLVISEATAVSPEGRISPADLGIWKDDHIDQLQKITSFIHQHGSVAGIQLAHAGRKASTKEPWNGGGKVGIHEGGWQTVAPSAIAFSAEHAMPVEMSKRTITKAIEDFATAAKRAQQAGFKLIEIHAAHGYLINEFLSPISNTRTDEYGGSFENRMRFLLEVKAAVQQNWPAELPIMLRISASDWVEEGWDLADSVALTTVMKEKGIDLVDCSSGGNASHAVIKPFPGYQVHFAEEIRKQTGMPTGAVGIIVDPVQANTIIENGQSDLVLLAREMLRDPHWPLRAAYELKADVTWPKQYERAKRVKQNV